MRSEEPDHDDAVFVLHQDDQAIVICLDIEDHSTAFENTCLRMSCLYVLRRLLSRALHYGSPRIVLRSGCLDPSISASRHEIAFDDVGADHDHDSALYLTSKKWNLNFHILEIAAVGSYEWLLRGEAIAMRLAEAAHARRSGVLFSSR